MELANRIVLVTGAHGFLGRHLARVSAQRGAKVVGIGHGAWIDRDWTDWGISSWKNSDVDFEALRSLETRPDVIFHCAGSGTVGGAAADPAGDFERTVGSTAHVLRYMEVSAPEARLVYPSSCSVYGSAREIPTPESHPARPLSHYGLHKHLAEQMLLFHSETRGLAVSIVRLFSVYGPGLRKQLLWEACTRLSRNENLFSGTGEETRDWLHVEDAGRLLLLAAGRASSPASVVNGGTGRSMAIREVLIHLFAALGRDDAPVFNGGIRKDEPAHYCAEPSRIRAWGFSPVRRTPEGIREYAEWFRSGRP